MRFLFSVFCSLAVLAASACDEGPASDAAIDQFDPVANQADHPSGETPEAPPLAVVLEQPATVLELTADSQHITVPAPEHVSWVGGVLAGQATIEHAIWEAKPFRIGQIQRCGAQPVMTFASPACDGVGLIRPENMSIESDFPTSMQAFSTTVGPMHVGTHWVTIGGDATHLECGEELTPVAFDYEVVVVRPTRIGLNIPTECTALASPVDLAQLMTGDRLLQFYSRADTPLFPENLSSDRPVDLRVEAGEGVDIIAPDAALSVGLADLRFEGSGWVAITGPFGEIARFTVVSGKAATGPGVCHSTAP